tara:strand:+ start:247 stop:945 length:699 start_codon:yes stop_codon:yes gene_type:complete
MRIPTFVTSSLVALSAVLLLAPSAEAQGGRLRKRLREAKQDKRAEKAAEKDEEGAAKKKQVAVHGGKLVEASGHVFEVVLLEKEIRVYATRGGEPVELKGATARVGIGVVRRDVGKRANHQGSSTTLRYVGVSAKKGRLRGFLSGEHKLGKADRQAIKLEITLSRVPKVKGIVSFEVSGVGTSALVTYACATCNEGAKTPRRFFDPGKCPQCKEAELAREGDKQRPGWRNRR